MEIPVILLLILTALAIALGAGIAYIGLHRRLQGVREENVRLATRLENEQQLIAEKERTFSNARTQLAETFSALAGDALKHHSDQFLKLAQENLKQFHLQAQGELSQREKAVENLVAPIREALNKTEAQLQSMEKERHQSYGALNQHLQALAESQRSLQSETRNLVQALRRPEVRGQWGELTLKRLVELAGLVEHCDFTTQESTVDTEGRLKRPDMVVRMPGGRTIVVDAKTPLDAYLTAVEANDDTQRQAALERHARKVRERVRELSAKSYWEQFEESPDFVVMFIPGEQFLNAALDCDRQLLEDALGNRVILSTPTSFIALLRAVAYGWRQETLAENAREIRQVGEELYGRLSVFADHLGKLGKSLEGSVGHFNKAIGSFESRITPAAKRFVELGISGKKGLGDTAQIETRTREIRRDDSGGTDVDD